MDQNRYLQGILGKIESVQEQKRDSLFVFDLDGTLYNNAPRTLRIIQEYAHQYAFMKPEVLEAVDRISVHQVQYRVADTLHAAGIDDPTYRKELQDFWFQRFFTNEYLLYDLPTEGAVEFVNAVYEMGAIPAYLTGRDAPNMLVGTIQTLQRDGFPVGTVDARVILKPQFEMGDTAYKQSVVAHLRQAGDVVAAFDNEPGLCNMFQDAFPKAHVFHVDMPRAPGPPPLHSIVEVIPHFGALLRVL